MTVEKEYYDYERELLPCPFCGGNASMVTLSASCRPKPVRIECDNCECKSAMRYRKCAAVKLWNKRNQPTPIKKSRSLILANAPNEVHTRPYTMYYSAYFY